MAEWSNAHAWKACDGSNHPGVRIPFSPPSQGDMKKKLTYIDLFCGAGGSTIGFANEHFELLLANDIDSLALETFKNNLPIIHPRTKSNIVVHGDIRDLCKRLGTKKVRVRGMGHKTLSVAKASELYRNKPSLKEHSYLDDYFKNLGPVDVLVGGPPCPGFSMIGRPKRGTLQDRSKGFIDDPRNQLFKYFLSFAERLNPKIVLIENVKGLSSASSYRELIEYSLRETGGKYFVHSDVLNAKSFGVPQNRERLIIIGVRRDIAKKLNLSSKDLRELFNFNNRLTSLREALDGLPEIKANPYPNNYKENKEIDFMDKKSFGKDKSNQSYKKLVKHTNYADRINRYRTKLRTPDHLYNHKARFHNDRDKKIFSKLRPGKYLNDPKNKKALALIKYGIKKGTKGVHCVSGFSDKYFKLDPERPSKTIIAHLETDGNSYVHFQQLRSITPREAARIQSFPDWYRFSGSTRRQFRQIGNAIPPLMARGLAKRIKSLLLKLGAK